MTIIIPTILLPHVEQIHPKEEKIYDSSTFPLVLTPQKIDYFTHDILTTWLKDNLQKLKDLLLIYGAIAFRGFPIETPAIFNEFCSSFEFEPFPYIGGAATRTVIVGNVVTANEAPSSEKIPFHHEMAQVPSYPKNLFFYCDLPAETGGQTPIVSSVQVAKKLREKCPTFMQNLHSHGVVYTRVLPDADDSTSAIGRSWQNTYGSDEKDVAVQKAKGLNVTLTFLPDGNVRSVSATLEAVKLHPKTKEETFFNSVVAAYVGWKDSRNDPKLAVKFGDGSLIDPNDIEVAVKVLDNECCDWLWQKGDVIWIDNEAVMHARRPFTGQRRIMASLFK